MGARLQSLWSWVTASPQEDQAAFWLLPSGAQRAEGILSPALLSSHCTVSGFQRGNALSPQIDLQKMPLGKLSKRQIQAAYSILSEVQQVSEGLALLCPSWWALSRPHRGVWQYVY